MRKNPFLSDHYYHVFNRGTEQRQIFLDDGDYRKFVFSMDKYRSELVAIVAYVLMPNHFHFLLRQLAEEGVSRYMHLLGTGFTMYFNARYDRSGGLFQGTFKAVPVESTEQLWHLSRYIHGNPVKKIAQQSFRERMQYLERYSWSSYPDYVQERTGGLVELGDFQASFLDLPLPKLSGGSALSAGKDPSAYRAFSDQYRGFMQEWLVDKTEAKPRVEA